MLTIALTLGTYSYGILLLGLLGILKPFPVLAFSILAAIFLLWRFKDFSLNIRIQSVNLSTLEKLIIGLTGAFFLIGLVGVLGPEIGFDALWYHLTIPKIFIQREAINFIEGNLFYYSLMPKLAEMLYIPSLMLGGEVAAKIVQYFFSVTTSVVLYQLIRLYLARKWALLGILIFNSNLVVAWLMASSYVDMARTFYETIAFFYILKFSVTGIRKHLLMSSVLLGLAVSVKIVSLVSILAFVLVILLSSKKLTHSLKDAFCFILLTLLIPMPWFIISFFYTRNPFYPVFSNYGPSGLEIGSLSPLVIIKNIFLAFLLSPDPINPIYIIALPMLFILWNRLKKHFAIIIYVFTSVVMWYLATYIGFWHGTDQAGSSRFLTPYLPGITLLTVVVLSKVKTKTTRNIFIVTIVLISMSAVSYRVIASLKYVPVVLGSQSKQEFLMQKLNFDFGDFYDEDGEIKQIVDNDKVLVMGIHNLYYADFKFTLPEWRDSKEAKYVLIRNGEMDSGFGKEIYQNTKTHVKLYRL